MFEAFRQYTSQFITLSVSEQQGFENIFACRQVPAKTKLTREGQTANELFFINKGLVRLYYTKEEKEYTGFIFREHLFASSYESFLQQTSSIQTLETIEDCELLVCQHQQLQQLYDKIPALHILARKVAEQRFMSAQMIISSFVLDSPEERYLYFLRHHGDLLLRVPHHIIASYLGISPVSLSRIRKRQIK